MMQVIFTDASSHKVVKGIPKKLKQISQWLFQQFLVPSSWLFLLTNTSQKISFLNKFLIKAVFRACRKSAYNARFVHIYWRNIRWKTSKSSKFSLVKCVFFIALYVIDCFLASPELICASIFLEKQDYSASNGSKLIFNQFEKSFK